MSADKHDPMCPRYGHVVDEDYDGHDALLLAIFPICHCALIAEVRAAALEEAAQAVEQWRSFTNDMAQQNLQATFAELIRDLAAGVPESVTPDPWALLDMRPDESPSQWLARNESPEQRAAFEQQAREQAESRRRAAAEDHRIVIGAAPVELVTLDSPCRCRVERIIGAMEHPLPSVWTADCPIHDHLPMSLAVVVPEVTPEPSECPNCNGKRGGYVRSGQTDWDWEECADCLGTGQSAAPVKSVTPEHQADCCCVGNRCYYPHDWSCHKDRSTWVSVTPEGPQ